MRRLASSSICVSCRTTSRKTRPSAILPTPSWISQRNASTAQKPGGPGRQRPSRMVLADNVYRSPATQSTRTRREGPHGGLNRTSANIDMTRAKNANLAQPAGAEESKEPSTDARGGGRDRRKGPKTDERKALKMQRVLASVSYGKRGQLKDRMNQIQSFDEFRLSDQLKDALSNGIFKNMIDVKPTPVQKLGIPALTKQDTGFAPLSAKFGKKEEKEVDSFLLAAETGSGKTLAYLLPAIDAMKKAEAEDPDIRSWNQRKAEDLKLQKEGKIKKSKFDEPHPTMSRPKVVVLVPTAELAAQVMGVSKILSHFVKFKTDMISSDLKPQQIQRNIYGQMGVDMVVATPHLLASIADSDPNILSRVTHLVVDEADSLLDRSFAPVTTTIIERAMPSLKQFICCSATIPRKMNNYLATNYPNMHRITTPNLHAIPRRVQLGVMDVSRAPYRNNKDLACAEALYSIGKEAGVHEGPNKDEMDVRRVIVFVNEREKTETVAEYLRSRGIQADALHRDTPEKRHGEILSTFTTNDPLTVPRPAKPKYGRLDNVKALVVTDLASRGIDTLAVRHVILYDVPHTTIDFIHRLGRAGRMGRRGRGIVLSGNDDRKDVIAEVKESMFMGQALI